MNIKEIINRKEWEKPNKKSFMNQTFDLLEKNKIILNKKEKQIFERYLKEYERNKEDEKAYEIVNILLKDANKKTINIKGRIIAEFKKQWTIVSKSLPITLNSDIYTNIRLRYMPLFSPHNKRKLGVRDKEGRLVIRRHTTPNGSLVQYHRDIIHFDEKVLYALFTISKEMGSRKVEFTLRQLCRMLKIGESSEGVDRVINSLRSLSDVSFQINSFLLEEGVKYHDSFSFLDSDYRIIRKADRSNENKKSFVYLNRVIFEHITNGRYLKKMNKSYFELKNGFEFKIFSYLNVLNRSVVILKLETLLVNLAIESTVIDEIDTFKNLSRQIKTAIKNLKKKKYIKDYEIEGRGKKQKYSFYL